MNASPAPPSLATILASPSVIAHSYLQLHDAVRLVRLSRSKLEEVSFLDERILTPDLQTRMVPFDEIAAVAGDLDLPTSRGFILHLSHVGSTLVSRLLGAHASVLSLREPFALRQLAELALDVDGADCLLSPAALGERLAILVQLWSRTYAPNQLAIIKGTSICSEIAGRLMAGAAQPRALALTSPPEIFIPVLLAGTSARFDLRAGAVNRIRRLRRRVSDTDWRLSEMSMGELAAMTWASEMSSLTFAADGVGDRLCWMDFDTFLHRPQQQLARAFAHFRRPVSDQEVNAIISGPLMRTYSKGRPLAFDASRRTEKILAARTNEAVEVARGQLWLDRAADAHVEIAQAIDTARMAAAA